MANDQTLDRGELLSLTTELVAAHVSSNSVAPDELAPFIQSVFDKLSTLGGETPVPAELTPAVPIRRSVTDEYLICLEDGKKLKMLKRHLMTAYGMTREAYRPKWASGPTIRWWRRTTRRICRR